jgi:hypothetical protein
MFLVIQHFISAKVYYRSQILCSEVVMDAWLYSLFPLLLYEETVVNSHQIGEFVFDLSGFSYSQIICLSVKKLIPCMQKDTAFLSHKSTSNSSSLLLLLHFRVRWHNIARILAHENQSLQASSSFTKRAPPCLVFSSCTQPHTQTYFLLGNVCTTWEYTSHAMLA